MPGLGTWSAGDILTAADLNAIGAWTSYTPTVTQNGTRTATINYAKYCVFNKFCVVNVDIEITNAGTAGNILTVSAPINLNTTVTRSLGAALFYDLSATDVILLNVVRDTASTFRFVSDASTSLTGFGSSPSLAVASGDIISFSAAYETV